MAGEINVSGVFIFTVAASNAVYNEVTCNLAAIKMSAYNVQEQPVVFYFREIDGDSKTALTAYPTLTVFNRSGAALVEHLPDAGSSISYTIPVTDLATADRVMVRIYSDVERTNLLAESASISIVRENPIPFPRGEVWADDMVFKNGETLLLDSIVYMWSSPVSGNSTLHPKTDIANNPTTTCWVAYQNWPLLCTNMMIARLALIGKAVFYDEFMFSQQGTDKSGNPSTNYQGFEDGTFKPNLLLNFNTGEFNAKKCTLEGSIRKGLSIHETGSKPTLVLNDKNNYFVNRSSEDITAIILLSTGSQNYGAELTLYHCGSGSVRLFFFMTDARMFLFKGKFYNEIRLTTLGTMVKLIYLPIDRTVCDPDVGGFSFVIENYSDFKVHTNGTTLINIT